MLARRAHGEAVIAIHVRGGRPDSKRVPCNVSYYIEAADKIAAELLLIEKKTVKWVFLCSDYQEEVLGSAASLSERFPRQWTYVLLPHLSMAPLINESHTRLREIQHLMEAKSLDRYGKPSREDIVVEYIADIEILAGANAFIGSSSNLYTLATGLRVARGNDRFVNHSCYMRLATTPPTFHCEGDPVAAELWQHHSLGGYSGGTLWWPGSIYWGSGRHLY
jgi:hypothetical protein